MCGAAGVRPCLCVPVHVHVRVCAPACAVQDLAAQTPHSAATASTTGDLVTFTSGMLDSFFNFATSFASTRDAAMSSAHADEHWVPLSCLHRWQENFQRKLAMNPMFWKK